MGDDDAVPMTVSQRIAALQKNQGKGNPVPPPQQPPNGMSDHIANLQKTVEPAFLSSKKKALEEKAKRVDMKEEIQDAQELKPKKTFKPPPGAVQVILPQFSEEQKRNGSD